MTIIDNTYDHEQYKALPLLADVLRRYDYAKESLNACCFVESLTETELWAVADLTEDEGTQTDAHRAADYMWNHIPADERYTLVNALQIVATDRMHSLYF